MKVQCQALEWTQRRWRNGHCPDRLFSRDLLTMIEEWRTVMATDFLAWAADPGLLEEINRRNLRSDISFDLMTMITGGSDGQGMDFTTSDWLWMTLLWLSYYHEDKTGYHDADNQHWWLSSWRRVCWHTRLKGLTPVGIKMLAPGFDFTRWISYQRDSWMIHPLEKWLLVVLQKVTHEPLSCFPSPLLCSFLSLQQRTMLFCFFFPLLSQQKQLYVPPGNNVVSQPVVTKVSEGGNESWITMWWWDRYYKK